MLDILTFRKGKKPSLPALMQAATCPACGHHVAVSFYDGGKAPLTTLAWPKSQAQAQAMEKLPLQFVRCVDCGHVFNKAFSYANVPYSDKPNLMYNRGTLWQTHLKQTHRLILAQLPENPVVVEIGAGDGHFIQALAQQNPKGRYIAFDPSGSMAADGLVEFYAEFFDPAVHMAEFKPDLIICRHMLEHLENPLGFIQGLSFAAAWESLDTALFIEVPCIDRVLESGRTVDFFYEHNSHFTSQSLRRLFERSNAAVEVLARGYEDEVVYGYARLGVNEASRPLTRESVSFFTKAQIVDEQVQTQLNALADSGKTVAFWGGTGKAATFLNRYGVDARRFATVVDSDLEKVGTYVPGMGQLIQAPTVLLSQTVDVIVITTQWRAQDIALEIERRGIRCQALLLEYQGQLVDFYHDSHPYKQPNLPDKARATG
jgi:protein O-GlcNAc transferase